MAEQEGSELEQEQTIITDQELLCYKPNTQVLLLAADHEKNKVKKPFLIFCNNNLQVGDRTKPVTIYNGVWHSTRPSREDHNLLGLERLSIHNYDVPPEGTIVQTTGTQANNPVKSDLEVKNTPTNPEPEKQDNSNSKQD
jgi:hypothetical protein